MRRKSGWALMYELPPSEASVRRLFSRRGTMADMTSSGASSRFSITSHAPDCTARVTIPAFHTNSPGTSLHTYDPSRVLLSVWSSKWSSMTLPPLPMRPATSCMSADLPLPVGPCSNTGASVATASASRPRFVRVVSQGTKRGCQPFPVPSFCVFNSEGPLPDQHWVHAGSTRSPTRTENLLNA